MQWLCSFHAKLFQLVPDKPVAFAWHVQCITHIKRYMSMSWNAAPILFKMPLLPELIALMAEEPADPAQVLANFQRHWRHSWRMFLMEYWVAYGRRMWRVSLYSSGWTDWFMDEQIKQILDIPFCCGNVVSQMVRGAYCVFSFLNLRLSAEDYLLRLQTTYRLEDRDVDTVLNSLYMKFGLTRPV